MIAAPQRKARQLFPVALLLILMTAAAYFPIFSGGFIWDDDSYVSENALLQSAQGLVDIWATPRASPQYYPLVFTSFWVEHQLWGLHPAGYHIVNVLLHAMTAVLLWRLLERLQIPGALAAAAIFAIHPVHVESVAWIAERKNVLSGMFYFLAMLAYFRFEPPDDMSIRRKKGWYIAAVACFTCALLSKTVTCSLPAAILVILWWKRGRIIAKDVVPLLPMFLLGGVFAFITAHLEQTHVGAERVDWQLSIAQRFLIAGRALWFYLGKLAAPANLCFVYPRWTPDASNILEYTAPIGWILLLCVLFAMQRRLGRGSLAALLFFTGTLVPALGFVDVFPFKYSFVADHFQYLASIGPIVCVVAWLAGAARADTTRNRRSVSLALRATCVAVIAVFGALTAARATIFQTEEAVWRDTLAKNDAAWSAHQNLGVLLDQRGEIQEAIEHFRKAIQLAPQEHGLYVNLAIAIEKEGHSEEAVALFEHALTINPSSWTAHYNLARTLSGMERNQEAVEHFEKSAALSPDPSSSYFNCGIVLEKMARYPEALEAFRKAGQARPDWINSKIGEARCLIQLSRVDDATALLRSVLEISPDNKAARQLLRQHGRP